MAPAGPQGGLTDDARMNRIDFSLAGSSTTVYRQTEVTRDLHAAQASLGAAIRLEVEDVELHDVTTDRPHVTFRHDGHSETARQWLAEEDTGLPLHRDRTGSRRLS